MFDPNSHHQGQMDHHHLHNSSVYNMEKKDSTEKPSQQDFSFVYNVNMLPKVPVQNSTSTFDSSQTFSYNYTLVNQISATYKCDVCGLVFAHLSLLNHHKRVHLEQNQDVVSTNTPTSNNSVMELHTCAVCNTSFMQACDLRAHELAAHNLTSRDNALDQKEKSSDKCEDCHGDMPEDDESESQPETPKTFPVRKKKMGTVTKCSRCNGSGIIIVPVPPSPDKPYRCNICEGTFSRYSSMWSHKKLHTGEKPFKCDVCGLAFARSSSLKNHTRVHTGERPYKCNVCGMQFSQAPHLKNHERIHSGERPYECDVCNKTFARHSTLWNHRRIHTGEKPYRCETCGSAFNQASHLRNHIKVHTGEKPFKCDICEVSFADKFALKRHRGIHEKYGQTARSNANSSSQQSSWKPQEEAAPLQSPPLQSPPLHSPPLQSPPPNSSMDDMYVPDEAMAFPGCSRKEIK